MNVNNKQRIVKEPEERKDEILSAAEKLFAAKGYSGTSVNDILFAVNIAKGTFYYHFKSKEDVLDALIERRIKNGVAKAEEIVAAPLDPIEKLLAILMAQKPESQAQEDFVSVLHEKDNSQMHEKSIVQSIIHLAPCIAKAVKEGIETGILSTPFPLESAEILLAAAMILFDDDFFQWTEEEKAAKAGAFLCVIERTFGAEAGSFSEFAKVFM
jgi:AcrR family transcriptional regulator